MKVTGRGDVFLAERAADIHLIDLEQGDALSINGANVLAFDSTLQLRHQDGPGRRHDVQRRPVQLRLHRPRPDRHHHQGHARSCSPSTSRPTSTRRPRSAGRPTCRPATTAPSSSASARCWAARTGEAFTMSFAGQGFVVVQPSEEPPGGIAGAAQAAAAGRRAGQPVQLTAATRRPSLGTSTPVRSASPARRRASQAAESAKSASDRPGRRRHRLARAAARPAVPRDS